MADAPEHEDEELVLDTPLDEAEEVEKPEGEELADGPAEWTIGDELPAETAQDSGLVKHLRSELKEMRRKLAEKEAAAPEAKIEVGEKPQIDDYWDKPEDFEKDLLAWSERDRKAKQQGKENEERQAAVQREAETIISAYQSQKQALGRDDYDDAEQAVAQKVGADRFGVLIQGANNAAVVIHTLNRFPDRLESLAKITNPAKFAVAIGKLEGEMKQMPRKSPKPEQVERGSASLSTTDKELEKLEKEAERTGDRTKIIAYRQRLRKAA